MKTFTTASLVALLSATAIASPLIERANPKPYTLMASKTDSYGELDRQIHAADSSLWVNRKTASYCPKEQVGNACPPGNVTSFVTSTTGLTSMNVEVPGGQQLYIAPSGLVSYTVAHSGAIPSGSVTKGVKKILTADERVWLCGNSEGKEYQVYVAKDNKSVPKVAEEKKYTCTRAKLTANEIKEGASAWQYS